MFMNDWTLKGAGFKASYDLLNVNIGIRRCFQLFNKLRKARGFYIVKTPFYILPIRNKNIMIGNRNLNFEMNFTLMFDVCC